VTPRATYRLQFRREFTFDSACAIVPYLAQLGISHVYASPILTARPGSVHGYDVVDHARINDELGGEAAFRRLVAALKSHNMGLIVDIVPNHMAVGKENAWWMDVLEHGRRSAYARNFDIDWDTPDPTLTNRVLLPVLGAPLAETLARGEITIMWDEHNGGAILAYAEHRFPLRKDAGHAISNGTLEEFRPSQALLRLLEEQHYRLAWWRTAGDLINWRRFFDINDLIALRMEDDAVFEAVHAKSLALYEEGLIDGFRIDHVDGLTDPRSYCRKLRARLDQLRKGGYLVVEKILAPGETLPEDWDVDGTTGYDFMNDVSAVLHDPAGAAPLARAWTEISGRTSDFHVEERIARRELLQSKFRGAFEAAARAFFATAPATADDMTEGAFQRAMLRLLGELRIYRTYATGDENAPAPGLSFDSAADRALRRAPGNDAAALQHILGIFQERREDGRELRRIAVRRFNQLAASLAAKAGEDTAFYRHGVLLSRNEVGSDPDEFALAPDQFHTGARIRLKAAPMLATATHDHKRGEDARMRLAVLSEIATEWLTIAAEWFELNAPIRDRRINRADEYQLYQTMIGAWPTDLDWHDHEKLHAFRDRILVWQVKSLHEAKLRSSWSDPDPAYEEAAAAFAKRLLDPERSREFLASVSALMESIAPAGALNGLVQTVLRCTAPGVPDLYQGTEFWDLSLVDPDNRRTVNFGDRATALGGDGELAELRRNWRSGAIKLHVIAKLLGLRRRYADCFISGDYRPLEGMGIRAGNVMGFVRDQGNTAIVVVVPRLCARACMDAGQPLPDPAFWGDTAVLLPHGLHDRRFHSLFDPQATTVCGHAHCAELFGRFPVAVLVSD
jgi:(1->4)-alpha-D-glucan 1-alpha-D-glucosylmutase